MKSQYIVFCWDSLDGGKHHDKEFSSLKKAKNYAVEQSKEQTLLIYQIEDLEGKIFFNTEETWNV